MVVVPQISTCSAYAHSQPVTTTLDLNELSQSFNWAYYPTDFGCTPVVNGAVVTMGVGGNGITAPTPTATAGSPGQGSAGKPNAAPQLHSGEKLMIVYLVLGFVTGIVAIAL
jgi:hypothetical protein